MDILINNLCQSHQHTLTNSNNRIPILTVSYSNFKNHKSPNSAFRHSGPQNAMSDQHQPQMSCNHQYKRTLAYRAKRAAQGPTNTNLKYHKLIHLPFIA